MPPPPNLEAMVNYQPGSARAWAAGWNYATARSAVDGHLRGVFVSSYQLAIDLNRHPAVMAARRQRRSAITALPWIVRGPERAPHRYETEAAVDVWGKIQAILGEIEDDLAVMGFAVLEHPLELEETEHGPRWVIREVRQFPLSCVEHGSVLIPDPGADPFDPDRYYAVAAKPDPMTGRSYHLLPKPGETDGHWTVIGAGARPHVRGAIVACDLEYVASQLSRRAWAKLQDALGKASVLGEMPESEPLVETDENGVEKPTSVGAQMMGLAQAIGETQTAGVHPHGARFYPLQVTATTADLLPQSVDASARMFALALLGHDALLGKDIYTDPRAQTVPQDLTRDDERTIRVGVSALLTMLGRLNAERCPVITVDGQIPDSDQDDRRKAVQERRAADDAHRAAQLAAGKLAADQLAAEKAMGCLVDDARIATVYALAGIEPPQLKPAAPAPVVPHNAPPPQ